MNLAYQKKTVYQHFKDKNDLIFKVSQYEFRNECDELDKLCSLYPNAIDQLLIISKYIVNKNLHYLNSSLIYAGVTQLARVPAFQADCCGFESHHPLHDVLDTEELS